MSREAAIRAARPEDAALVLDFICRLMRCEQMP